MRGVFDEEVDWLHEEIGPVVRGTAGVAEIFAERTFREELTHSFGGRDRRGAARPLHGAPTEAHRIEELAGAGLRRVGTEIESTVVDGLDPHELKKATAAFFGDPAAPGDHAERPDREMRGSFDLPRDAADRVSLEEKRYLLRAAADAALSLEPDLTRLEVSFRSSARRVCVWATDIPPTRKATTHVALRVRAASSRAYSYAVGGASGGVGYFLENSPETIASRCVERLRTLEQVEPSRTVRGKVPVLVEGGWGGVWLHEAIGHLLEADTPSPYDSGDFGRRVGREDLTVVDDGSVSGGRGSSAFDDEGMPAARTVLVDQGVLRRLMTDRRSAVEKGIPRTPNGRRQDYRSRPLPRMTNLCLEAGSSRPSDLLSDVPRGLSVRTIGGGGVRPDLDLFWFDVMEGYVIEQGRRTAPVTALRVRGRPSRVLEGIVGIGDDFRLDPARGTCVKAGQRVPVSVGMPTVLLHGLDVAPAS